MSKGTKAAQAEVKRARVALRRLRDAKADDELVVSAYERLRTAEEEVRRQAKPLYQKLPARE